MSLVPAKTLGGQTPRTIIRAPRLAGTPAQRWTERPARRAVRVPPSRPRRAASRRPAAEPGEAEVAAARLALQLFGDKAYGVECRDGLLEISVAAGVGEPQGCRPRLRGLLGLRCADGSVVRQVALAPAGAPLGPKSPQAVLKRVEAQGRKAKPNPCSPPERWKWVLGAGDVLRYIRTAYRTCTETGHEEAGNGYHRRTYSCGHLRRGGHDVEVLVTYWYKPGSPVANATVDYVVDGKYRCGGGGSWLLNPWRSH